MPQVINSFGDGYTQTHRDTDRHRLTGNKQFQETKHAPGLIC